MAPLRMYNLIDSVSKSGMWRFSSKKWKLPVEIPKAAKRFDVVEIGKNSDPAYKKTITSFFNKDKRLILKTIEAPNQKPVVREYFDDFKLTKYGGGGESVSVRNINTSEIANLNGVTSTVPLKKESQYVTDFFDKTKGDNNAKKLTIQKSAFEYDNGAVTQRNLITEYPMNLGFEPKSAKKVLGVDTINRNGEVSVIGTEQSMNIAFPSGDKYLAHRFFTPDEKRLSLTKMNLKEKGLDKMGINIDVNSTKIEGTSTAQFSAPDREIRWNKFVKSDERIPNTAAHEVEHGVQLNKIGRLGKGASPYEQDCLSRFGRLPSKETAEAQRYYEARMNYPKREYADYDKLYRDNYLEVKAREKGEAAQKLYDDGREFIRNQFRFIPDIEGLL